MASLSDGLRRAARAPLRPIAGYFNRRFADVHEHLENETVAVNTRLDEALATTRSLQERVATDLEVLSELTLSLERVVRRLEERVSGLELERDHLHEHGTKA